MSASRWSRSRVADLPRLPVLLRAALAVAAGLSLHLAFPEPNIWWCAPLGVLLLSVSVLGCGLELAFVVGLLGGLAMFVPTLSWSGVYVGALPWLALAALEALYIALMCVLITAVQRPLWRRGWRAAAYAVAPLAWVAQEAARSSTPFGGFPWARLAFSQADGPLVHFAAYAGVPGVSLAVAAMGVAGHAALRGALCARRAPLVAGLALAALLPLGAAAVPLPTSGPTERVGIVQGNVPRPGLEFNAERRKVLDNHVQETTRLLRGEPKRPALIIWPENSSDIDPLRNADAAQAIRTTVQAAGVPILLGAVLDEPAPKISNVSLVYRPGSDGPPERYVKQHPVPFAEYIPYRSFFRSFSDKVDLVRSDFAAGDRPGAFRIRTADGGSFWAVPTICFEVAYDDLVREAVTQPGKHDNLLVVQTNNATFGYTAESEQQFAISRLRAIEHGRSVAHVSTVGVSALIRPDGTFARKSKLFTADEMVADLPIRSGLTISDRVGSLPELSSVGILLALATLGLLPGRAVTVKPSRTHNRKEPIGV